MVRRPHSNHPAKVGSDIHDLVRLVNAAGARDVGDQIAAADPELARLVATHIETAFGKDLRYTIMRLRRHDSSAASRALTDDDIAGVAILADVIQDDLAQ